MNLLEQGRYRPSDAARLANLPVGTVRRWLAVSASHPPERAVVQRSPATPRGLVSFLDLVELAMVPELKKASGLSTRRIREHLQEAARLLGASHPLARKRFLADGSHLFVGLGEGDDAPFVELGTGGQLQLEQIVRERAQALDFGDDLACRWYPLGRERPIVVDPAVGWGSPVVVGTRIFTRTLASAVRAENNDFEQVARLYELPPEAVHAAVEYEGLLAAA